MDLKVWDLPTRVFHWALAAAACGLLVTAKAGEDFMPWHARLGYGVGVLLLFRLVWGLVGGHWSRFASFPPSIARARAWLRTPQPAIGHNPLGAFSVYAMLLFFALQVGSGLFSETKEDFAGPLAPLVSNAAVHWLTGYHRNVGQWVLIALVTLHLVAIAWYAFRGENLAAAMVTGRRASGSGVTSPESRDDAKTRIAAALVLSLCSLAMWAIVRSGG